MEIGSISAEGAIWIVSTITALFLLYRRGTSNFNFFSDQGIPGPKPVPFIGNIWGIWKRNLPEYLRNRAKEFGKMYGTFEGTTPTLHTIDTEIIKMVFVKDFDHFVNRRDMDFSKVKVFRYLLTTMTDQPWKDVRSAVTPTFTSGKIKRYAVQMKKCTDMSCLKLHSIAAEKGKLSLKEEMGILTMSVIAKCAFGMTIDNLGGKDDPFLKNAQVLVDPPQFKSPGIMLLFLLPATLLRWFTTTFFPMESWKFFFDIVETMTTERSKSPEKYHDFPETATEAISAYTKEENGKKVPMWSKEQVNEIVTAQAVLFMLAGYSTTANALTSCCFMLAQHPEEQEKLYDLIMKKLDQYGDICHELVQDIPYLEYFMNEVFRMYPAVPSLERRCNKDVVYNGIHIKKDMIVSVSTHALHYSEEYYADPETFNPDRWNPENKANMDPYAFMPFGMGPRNCIANRFAQEEVKMVLCTLIKQFRFFPVEETPMKLTNDVGIGSLDPLESTVGIATRM